MADSEAARQRRRRAHTAGDHSLCTTRCDAAGVTATQDADPVTDPVAERAALAGRLAAAHRADPGRADLGRVLLQVLQAMEGKEPPEADEVDKIRAEWEAGSGGV